MNIIRVFWAIGTMVFAFIGCNNNLEEPRITEDFNFNWKFSRGDFPDAKKPVFDDSLWRDVRLPHDWSVEESFTQENTGGSTAFLPGGIGWYRKTFKMPESAADKVTWIEFDGVYNNSEVWINGQYLGKRPYGYICFSYDLTPYLNYGEETNVIAVKVDRSAYLDCRWYPGSGIYRNVRLVITNKVHIPQWGTFVTTPAATNAKAEVSVKTTIINELETAKTVVLVTKIVNKNNKKMGEQETEVTLEAGEKKDIYQLFEIANPFLWDTESPNMYCVKSTISDESSLLDDYSTHFGIRDIRYDSNKGFFLNGKSTLFKGVCLHHDGGCVGAAVPIGVWERRLKLLKEAGCNAIRTAHNPPAADFLDLCDRMGFLVQDEAFDEWNNPKGKGYNYNQEADEEVTKGYTRYFNEWAEADIKNMVLRDRNHPSIVMWSIGNEIEWTYPRYSSSTGYWDKKNNVDFFFDLPPYDVATLKKNFYEKDPGKYELAATAKNLSKWIKEIDTTRPVTANLVIPCISHFSGYTDVLDILGYSYRQAVYDYGHNLYPDKMIVGTENWGQWREWNPVIEKEYLPGIFLWTGISYLGESRNWPTKGSGSGLLDFAGFKYPRFHMFKSLWNDEPHIYITTKELSKSVYKWDNEQKKVVDKIKDAWKHRLWGWQPVNEHWNYQADDSVVIEVYTNCREVELFVNNKSLGVKKLADFEDRIIKWLVSYAEGKITAVGKTESKPVKYELATSKEPAMIKLTADKKTLKADSYDVVHFTAQLCDSEGIPVKTENREIVFDIQGDCRLLGVDNGSSNSVQDYKTNRCMTSKGKCLLIIQSNDKPGKVTVSALAGSVESQSVNVKIR